MSEHERVTVDFPAPVDGQPDLLVIAGEHSGDEHAALVVADLLEKNPKLKVACLGGVELQAVGAQLLYDLTEVSIVGFVEVVRHYSFFKSLFDRTLEWIERYQPKHVCFVDYPGFNLRLAAQLCERGLSKKGGGAIGLSYYIGPQVWAWKAKRRFKMAELIDQLGVIFPFEVECFADTTLKTQFVGHPFVRDDYQHPFQYDTSAPVLLLPGSRTAAVGRIFPLLLDGFKTAKRYQPDLTARVVYPSQQILELLQSILEQYTDLKAYIEFVPNTKNGVHASAVLMSSGTMSLAVAMSGIPGAIAYRLNPMSYWLGKLLVKIEYIGISNLLLKRSLNPEYIQGAATPKALAAEIVRSVQPEAADLAQQGAEELSALLQTDSGLTAADWLADGMGV